MAFYQKYRSKTFGELVGQEHVAKTLLESIRGDKLVHSYLLTGPRGIGKTSTARLLAKAVNCQKINESRLKKESFTGEPCNECDSCLEITAGRSLDVIEIDAASHTGVDDVRDLIEKARLSPTKSLKKVYIIDEVHMLSKSAFNALLKTLEEPPSHAVFILATTEIHKIPATIISRTQRFDFKRASKDDIIKNLKNVAKLEKITVDEASLDLMAVSAAGGHRDALSLLEQVASASNNIITLEMSKKILGVADDKEVLLFVKAIFDKTPEEGLKIAQRLYDSGYDLAEFNRKVIEALRKVMLCSINAETVFEDTAENIAEIKALSSQTNLDKIMPIIEFFIEASSLLKEVQYPMLPLEIAIVKATTTISNSEFLISNPPAQAEQLRAGQIPNPKFEISKNNVILSEAKDLSATKSGDSSAKPQNDKLKPQNDKNVPQDDKQVSNSTHSTSSGQVMKPIRQAQGGQSNNEAIVPQADLVPVPVLEMTKDIWHQVIEETKKENSTLAALLRDANPEEVTADTVTLGVKFKFHKDRISEKKNCDILESIISQVTGVPYRIKCRIATIKPKLQNSDEKIDQEKAVAEVFEI